MIATLVSGVAKAQCTLTATITDVTCYNNTTSDPADDKYTFTLTVNATGDVGGFVQVDNGLGGQQVGEAKVHDKLFFISAGTKTLTITAGNGSCSTTVELVPPTSCSPTCTWDPTNLNPSYATWTIERDCKGTSDLNDDTVSGTFSVTGVPAGYTWELDRKLNETGTAKVSIATGLSDGQTVNWGPVSVSAAYPGQNGFVLWFMLEGVTDCLGDVFVTLPDCPTCAAPTPQGTGETVCINNTATLTATGCTTGYTANWYANSTLAASLGTGDSFTPSSLTQTTDYYVACVKDGEETCKSAGVKVTATIKPLPTLTAGTPTCAPTGLTYSVTVTSNGTITADAGTVSGLTVSNIPAGTDVNITATLDGCTTEITVTSPTCSIPCNAPTPTGTGDSVCPDNTAALSASGCTTGYTAAWYSDITLDTQEGTGNSFTTPSLTQTTTYYVACVDNSDPFCKSDGVSVTATVKPLPTLTAGTPTCAQNGLTYSVTVTSNGTITADAGTVSGLTVSNIPAGTDVNITATLNGCTTETTVTSPNCVIPCNAPTPTGTGDSVCPDNTATLSASGCTTGFTATWYSNAVLTAQVGTGNSFTTPILTQTTTYYVACVQNSDATCKSTGVPVDATVKPAPVITITSTVCNGTTVTATFTVTSGATITSSLGTVAGNQVTGIPSGQTFTLTANLNGCEATASDSKTCVANCDLTAVVGTIQCTAGTNTTITSDDAFTFELTVTGTGGASNLWEAVYNGNVIQTGAYGQTKVVTVGVSTLGGATSMAITVRDKDNTVCTDNVTVQVPNCSPAPCTGFAFTNYTATCEAGLYKICFDVTGTGGRKWHASLKISNDFTVPGIPLTSGTGDQTNVCATISATDFAILQAFDPDHFILWGMPELADGTGIIGEGCEIDYTVPYSPCTTCQAPTPAGQGTSICAGTTAIISASGCTTGYTATWFSDAGLGTQLGTGANFTTPSLTQTTDYYAACVKDADPTCKSAGVKITVTVKPKPTVVVTATTCNQAGTAFDVTFTATAGATVTADKGTLNGNTVTGVPSGQTVKLIVTLDGCKDSTTATKNCSPTCQAPTPTGQGTSICAGTTAIISASGCTTGYTATWFSDAGLGTQLGTGANFTTPSLTQTTDYYAACVKDADPTCKSAGVKITVTVKPKPTVVVTAITCNQAGTAFDVTFTATAGATVTADKGTLSGNTVTGVPSGQIVKLIVTLDGCKDSTTATKNCSTPCVKSTVTLTGTPVCSADIQTYSLTFNITNKVGIVKVNKGILSGSNPYTVTGIPSGATITITDSLSAVCKFDTLITGPNCNCNPPTPLLLTPSLTACIGDTFPTIKATVVGLATVEWFATATSTTVLFTGLNFKPTGTVPATGATFYAQARSTDPDCPLAVSTARVPATINAQDCTKEVDLALKKSINKKIAQIGDILTYTIKVWNESNTNATGVEVTDSIATTVEFVAGSFTASRGSAVISGNVIKWTIGNIAANGDTVTLTYQIKATQEGIHFNTAEICKANEKDVDSTPCNHDDEEDDIDYQCFTVPIKLCPTEKVQASVPLSYTNVQWFLNGSTTPTATGNVVLLSAVGTYTYTATNQTCPAGGCCPIIIEAGINCCVEQLCVPFTVKKLKK